MGISVEAIIAAMGLMAGVDSRSACSIPQSCSSQLMALFCPHCSHPRTNYTFCRSAFGASTQRDSDTGAVWPVPVFAWGLEAGH